MRELRSRQYPPQPDVMDMILKAICDKAAAAANRTISLSASYMTFVPKEQADDILIQKALFTKGMPGRYSGYLELKRASLPTIQQIVLPIAVKPDEVLPGPPKAVSIQSRTEKYSMMHIRDIKFDDGIVAEVEREVREHYKHPYFKDVVSIASIPVYDTQLLFGVVSIESTASDIFGEGKDMADKVIESLQPLVALLAAYR